MSTNFVTSKHVRQILRLADAAERSRQSLSSVTHNGALEHPFPDGWQDKRSTPEEQKLEEAIECLSRNARAELLALNWIGSCVSDSAENFEGVFQIALREGPWLVNKLMSKANLAENVQDGWRKLAAI